MDREDSTCPGRVTSRLTQANALAFDGNPTRQEVPSRARPADVPAVVGSYRVGEVIGRGGMGTVYRAEHKRLSRPAAIKLLHAKYAKRRDAVARFFQEAQAVNKVRHRNLVDVSDFLEQRDGGAAIVMELLEGGSLRRLLEDRCDLGAAFCLDVALQVCAGLEAAHAVGVIHRDLKPDNIFVCSHRTGDDWVKLLDFGVAKLGAEPPPSGEGAHEPPLTRTASTAFASVSTTVGDIMGTPAYMSPEQAAGAPVDERSDIYSLGAILYEMFCGVPVFEALSMADYATKHREHQPVPPRQTPVGQAIDADLERLIMRCLRKHPRDRCPSAAAVRAELAPIRARCGYDETARVSRRAARARAHRLVAAGLLGTALVAAVAVVAGSEPSPAPLEGRTVDAVVRPAATVKAAPAADAFAPEHTSATAAPNRVASDRAVTSHGPPSRVRTREPARLRRPARDRGDRREPAAQPRRNQPFEPARDRDDRRERPAPSRQSGDTLQNAIRPDGARDMVLTPSTTLNPFEVD